MTELLAHVRGELTRAWGKLEALGWEASRFEIRVDENGEVPRVRLIIKRVEDGEYDCDAFIVAIFVRGDSYWVASSWQPLRAAPAVDLDRVDRAALARMFPDWDTWRDSRSTRSVKGTIRRAT